MEYFRIKNYVLNRLRKELDHKLTYHCVEHTMDVIEAVERLSKNEGIGSHDRTLLMTAAVFHDFGFLETYKGHEEISCIYAAKILPDYGYNPTDIKKIREMIMATQIPQSPKSILGELLCDADLDYLGTDRFEPIANNLFKELLAFNFIQSEEQWNRIQLSFLENHQYFTKSAIKTRDKKKQKNLDKIREIVACYNA
jgi:uncharacterized protein